MRQLKIGWLLTYMGPGGGVRTVLDATNELAARGHDVYVINPGGCRSGFTKQNSKSLSMGANWDPANASPAKGMKFDVIINQDPATVGWSSVLDAKLKILHVCSAFPTAYEVFKGQKGTLYDIVTTVNHRLEKEWLEREPKTYYIGQAVDHSLFHPAPSHRNDNLPVICFCSRGGMLKWNAKGAETIARALPLIRGKANFFGWDTDRHPELGSHGIKEVITNPIIHARMWELYAAADIVIAPDYVSSWNCVTGEAMACGKAVVCSDQGTEDFVVHNENGLVFPAGDAEALAKNVNLLLEEPATARRLATAAQETLSKWTWESVVDRLEKAIEENLQ